MLFKINILNLSLKLIWILFILLLAGCNKDPGEGGNSSIMGTVHTTWYDATFINVLGSYNDADEWVYIIYGDGISYGNRVRTNPDGKFEFNYLRKGNYTIYVYSEDASVAGKHAESKTLEITGRRQTLDAGIFEIRKH